MILFTMAVLAAGPMGLPDAELIAWSPKVSEVSTLLPFFTRAGQGSVLLSPASWRHAAHPLLEFDVFSPDSIAATGVAPSEGLSLSLRGPISVACHSVADAKSFEAACKARLERFGTPFRTVANGVITLGARDALNRVQAAALLRGKDSCSVSASGQTVEKLIPDVTKLLGKPLTGAMIKAGAELKGVQTFLIPERAGSSWKGWGAFAVSSRGTTLTVDGRVKSLLQAQLQPGGPSPFAGLSVPGVGTVKARIEKSQLPGLMDFLSQFPGGRTLAPAGKAVAPFLTGNVVLVVSRVKLSSGLRSPVARFFATRFALAAEVEDVGKVQAALEAVDPKGLSFREGTVSIGMIGSTVWVANDADASERLVAALPSAPGTLKHGAEFEIDPQHVAQALSSIPLLEIVQSPELSAVLVAATEAGPVLTMSERLRGWVDSGAPTLHSLHLLWQLKPERTEADPPRTVP